MHDGPHLRFLLGRLALQNLGQRKARTLLLAAAMTVCSGALLTGAVLMRSIETSMAVGFTRLGADMLIVPAGTLTNITAALLTAEPTDLTLDADMLSRLADLKGVRKVAPQLIFRTDASGYGRGGDLVDLIAFDPARDMTVQPWLEQRLDRPLRQGDVIVGGRRQEAPGSELLLFGRPLVVYGKLGKTAVGTHERGLFITFETLSELREIMRQICGTKAALEPNKLSGVLIELAPGATTQQVRFAALANFPGIKVVAGDTMLTSIRQGLAGLLNGMLGLMAIMFFSTALMVSVLFSAVVTERRRELGLLRAVGARRGQVLGLLLAEAALATGAGGLVGCVLSVLLMRVYEHSLVYHLEDLGIPFVWLNSSMIAAIALLCILLASLIGAAGALYPAWRASREEPYDLVRSEG
ncbi:MAG TPA: ABC transporter permease [Xanthobacteraceae bacterium]|jgi:putative ABC transport system permease protein